MISRKHNSHIVQTLTVSLVCLILSANVDVALSAWQPPIGIPAPSFGINETVDMYIGQQYTFTDGRGTIDYLISSVTGKPYTHYVHREDDSSTDSSNPYGTETTPRKTIPTGVAAGSVIEVHGSYTSGGYPYPNNWFRISGLGTAQKPVFVRSDPSNPARIYGTGSTQQARVGGTYLIIENFDFDNARVNVYRGYNSDHISIRNLEVHNGPVATTSAIYAGGPRDSGGGQQYIVVYNNHIHDNGDSTSTTQNDYHGVTASKEADYIWIVDNHMHENGGDSIQINSGNVTLSEVCRYLYIGRNLMHDEDKNAVDLKQCADVIVSENTMYNFDASIGSSDGTAMIVNGDAPKENIWVIFNEIYNSSGAIRSELDSYLIGNIIHNISNNAVVTWPAQNLYIVGNTMYNIRGGIEHTGGGTGKAVYLHNNIISLSNTGDFHIDFTTALTANSLISHNIFDSSPGTAIINWNGVNTQWNLSQFQQSTGQGAGCTEGNPFFVDAANNDFHLQLASPAIDAGTSSGVVKQVFDTFQNLYGIDIRQDIEGTLRTGTWDIGAYESGNPNILPLVLQPIGDKSVDENVTLTFNIHAIYPNGEPITYSAQSLPSGATLDSQTGDFAWTPSYTQAGSYSVTFRASDGNSQDSETITITVNNINP